MEGSIDEKLLAKAWVSARLRMDFTFVVRKDVVEIVFKVRP